MVDFGKDEKELMHIVRELESGNEIEESFYYNYSSPIGDLRCVSNGKEITWLTFSDWRSAKEALKGAVYDPERPEFKALSAWLDDYFSGGEGGAEKPPYTPVGTDFQKRVWELIEEIPRGKTRSYGDIAKEIAKEEGILKMAAQAVGSAVGANKITILIPCHRVVGASGIGGYGGYEERKRELLKLEGAL